MYNRGDQGTLEVISGTVSSENYAWETVFSWQPVNFESDPVLFDTRSVISLQQSGASLMITWVDRPSSTYIEGIATQYLDCNLQSKVFEEFWSD